MRRVRARQFVVAIYDCMGMRFGLSVFMCVFFAIHLDKTPVRGYACARESNQKLFGGTQQINQKVGLNENSA